MSLSDRKAPPALRSGQAAEIQALRALCLVKNTEVWRPSDEQVKSAAFRIIVGDPRYTPTGLARGTVLDAVGPDLAEIKSGASVLDSTYQLRLQTYRSVVERNALTIYTSRPVESRFGRWLDPHGVKIRPLPPEPGP
jgi:filamentous hemagglutinin